MILLLVIVVIIAVLLITCIKIVPQAETMVIERLGSYLLYTLVQNQLAERRKSSVLSELKRSLTYFLYT